MNGLRDFITATRNTTTTPRKHPRTEWDEHDMSIALNMRYTAKEAACRIGCSAQTVWRERWEWSFE